MADGHRLTAKLIANPPKKKGALVQQKTAKSLAVNTVNALV
jgi:hypothetical protein